MRGRFWAGLAVAAVAVLAASGCATVATPEGRIERNQAYFDSLPVAVQARIRGGQTDVGFTAEQTLLAMGEPQRKWVRRTDEEETEVWFYTATEQSYERQHVDFVGVPDGRGGRLTGGGFVNALREKEVPVARVELRGGVVTAVEMSVGGPQ
jgi:hypothetical protein